MRRLPGSLAPLSAALLLALSLTGCGDDSDSADEPDASPSSSETASDDPGEAETSPDGVEEDCAFLNSADVSEAVGETMQLTTAGPQTCFFEALGDASELQVVVNEVPISVDTATYAETARDICEGDVTDVDVPGAVAAFACVVITTQGFLYVEGDSIVVDVNGIPDDETGLAAAAALLPKIEVP